MANSSKKGNFLLPAITDLKSAQEAGRQGTAVSVLIIVFSSVITAISTATNGGTPSQGFIVMMLVYGLIAFMIYKMSRVAAILGLVIYLSERLFLVAQYGVSGNVILVILFVFAFINSIRGTFAYHRLRRQRTEAFQESNIPSI